MTLELYADETKPNDVVPFFGVAGYVFEDVQARKFNDQWEATLKKDGKGMPFFRMSKRIELQKKYGLTADEMKNLVSKLIKRLKHRTLIGRGVTVNHQAYQAEMAHRAIVNDPRNRRLPSTYGFACFCLMQRVRRWMDQTGRSDDVFYYFESGEDSQGEADEWLKAIFANSVTRERFRYAGHGFMPKDKAPALQGGDLLAWHLAKMYRCELEKRPVRADLKALIRPQDVRVDYTPEEIRRTVKALEESGLICPAS
jgi:hypothetical protein